MLGGLEAVEEAAFMVFTDLTSDEVPKERRNYFRLVELPLLYAPFMPSHWLLTPHLRRAVCCGVASLLDDCSSRHWLAVASCRRLVYGCDRQSVDGRSCTSVLAAFSSPC
jgi:hypothetical protein